MRTDHTDVKLVEKLKLGAKVAGFGLIEVDYIAGTVCFDATAAEIFDLPAAVWLPRQQLHDRIHPDDLPVVNAQLGELVRPAGLHFMDVEHRILRGNGTVTWVNARKQVTFRDDPLTGKPVLHSGLAAVLDVTAHKNSEEHVRFLLHELGHRSRNTMALVQSIARQSARTGPEKEFADRFGERMRSLARSQDLLVRNSTEHVSLRKIVTFHLAPFVDDKSDKVLVSGPEVALRPTVAQVVGMALHELATNATKYGALGSATGKVAILWTVTDDPPPLLRLQWTERGGPEVAVPTRSGFGQTVMKTLVAATTSGKTTLDYHPTGVEWQLEAALGNLT